VIYFAEFAWVIASTGKIHKIMRAILIGATGLVGGLLLEKLLKDPSFSRIKLISRTPVGIQHAKLGEAIINFDNEAMFKKEVTDADVLFCSVGTTQKKVKGDNELYRKIDFGIPVNAAKFCAEQRIGKYVLVSSVGANASSSNFYLQLKGETETAVLSQSISAVYIMRPSILLGNRNESRPGETIGKAVMQFFSVFLFGSIAKYKAIHAKDVAEAMLAASKKIAVGKFICEYHEMMALIHER
jgi:uncharacterized protein YbjT (DUF2867 family)